MAQCVQQVREGFYEEFLTHPFRLSQTRRIGKAGEPSYSKGGAGSKPGGLWPLTGIVRAGCMKRLGTEMK